MGQTTIRGLRVAVVNRDIVVGDVVIHKVAAPDKVLLKLVDVIEAAYQRGREDFRAELLGLIGAQRSEDQP